MGMTSLITSFLTETKSSKRLTEQLSRQLGIDERAKFEKDFFTALGEVRMIRGVRGGSYKM